MLSRKGVEAFHVAETQGHASRTVDAKMIDYSLVERAKRVLAVAEVLHACPLLPCGKGLG